MSEILENAMYIGVCISLLTYGVGMKLKQRIPHPLCNPLLISILLTIGILLVLGIDYDTYQQSGKYLSYLLTPATVSLAIPLYEQLEVLKRHWKAVAVGVTAGVISSLGSVFAMAMCFGLSHKEYVTMLPKSITTAIGMSVSEEMGGYVSITVAAIVVTGIFGNVFAEKICKWFCVTEPVAKGLAIGTASHAMGTAKAMEMGEVEGAMSSLAIVVAGLITVVGASVFAGLM